MKVGLECEGRHKGMPTLFLDASELPIWRKRLGDSLIRRDWIEQLYVSDLGNTLNLEMIPPELENVSPLTNDPIITIERTMIPSNIHPRIEIMLHVINESFWRLGGVDQIKFSKDKCVFSIKKDQMVKTIPTDFEGDKEL